MNKYLEILLNSQEEDDINETIQAIRNIDDKEDSTEMVNILVALDIIPKEVIAAIWSEFGRLNK